VVEYTSILLKDNKFELIEIFIEHFEKNFIKNSQ